MTQQQRRRLITTTVAAALIAATTSVEGLTLPSSATSSTTSQSTTLVQLLTTAARGGGNSAEDDELDAYINALVAEVESEEVEVIEKKPEVVPEVVAVDEPADDEEEVEEEEDINIITTSTSEEQATTPSEADDVLAEATTVTDEVSDEAADVIVPDEPTPESNEVEEEEDVSSVPSIQQGTTPTVPPNGLYRFFLSKERMGGHVLIMVFVWIAEFIEAYLPALANLWATIMTLLFGKTRRGYDGDYSGKSGDQKVNDQYAAFVSDNRAMRGKERKQVSKQADADAADQLRRVGSGARYKHLSQNFMQRHAIGMYAAVGSDGREEHSFLEDEEDEEAMLQGKKKKAPTATADDDDEDEDVDWVVEALSAEEPVTISTKTSSGSSKKRRKKRSSTKITPRVDVGVSNTGVTVGVGFSIGGKGMSSSNQRKSSRSKKTALIAAAIATPQKTKKAVTPQRAGESGMFGRIRDFGANNLVSRSLMGAYPGDALTPSDAADSTRLLDLASKKYGYGDWSDDEDDDDFGSGSIKRRKKRRSVSNTSSSRSVPRGSSSSVKKAGKRRTKSTSATSASVQFDMSSTNAAEPRVSLKRTTSSAKKRSSKMVRLPTERLSEGTKVLDFDLDTDSTDPKASTAPKRSTSVPRKKRSSISRTLPTDKTANVNDKDDAALAKMPPTKNSDSTVPRRKRSSKVNIVRLPTDLPAESASVLDMKGNQDD